MKGTLAILIIAVIIWGIFTFNIPEGSIIIKENIAGNGCIIEFSKWSEQNKCELSLNKDDELQVEVEYESGSVALDITGTNGANPYTGNNLDTCLFTVKIPQAGEYVITIEGKNATGRIAIKNLER